MNHACAKTNADKIGPRSSRWGCWPETQEKKPQTPEEQERQKQLDDAYKAATNEIPDHSANDPWASVRTAPATPAPKKTPQ